MDREKRIQNLYQVLSATWGPQHWWPAESRFEVIVGAYLTQNTAWTNVEHALENLRREHVLTVNAIRNISLSRLETLVRPAGYFRQKAQRLKTFIGFLDEKHSGSLVRMFAQPTQVLRAQLLDLNGVGPETADSILLYAGNHPVFVVDAYTRRILDRHDIVAASAPYEEVRDLFERALGPFDGDCRTRSQNAELPGAAHRPSRMSLLKRTELVQRYNEMHALIVGVGKNHCSSRAPECEGCPLRDLLPVSR